MYTILDIETVRGDQAHACVRKLYFLCSEIYCLPSIAEIGKKVETKILDFFYIYMCERLYLRVSKMCSRFFLFFF